MLLPLFVALLQTPAPRPVRVWLGSGGLLTRGTPVRVYVRATQDGNLIVLHRRTDGRVEVLFPGNPSEDPYVRAGTYEIQATADRVAFVVAEPDGSGLVLAALAPAGYRFDEFVREAAWNPDALAPSWNGADGEGALSDIVQRMLGDGYFNYDIATYSVAAPAPPLYAMQQDSTAAPYPMYPTCTDCTFIGFQENVFEPVALCDAFFSPCLGAHFRHFGQHSAAPTSPTMRVLALSLGGSHGSAVIPQDGRAPVAPGGPRSPGRFVRKGSAPVSPTIGTRARPPGRAPVAIALGPGRPAVARPPAAAVARRRVSAAASTATAQVVRLTLSPTARDEPAPVANTGSTVLTGLTVTRTMTPELERRESGGGVASRPRASLAQQEALAGAALPRTRAVAVAGGSTGAGVGASAAASGATRSQAIAVPSVVFQGAQARVPVARGGVRHR